MTEICAAMGLTNLTEIEVFLEINHRNYKAYKEGFANIPGLTLIEYDKSERCNWQYIVIEVGDEYPLSRDELMDHLHSKNIRARRYFWPGCHRMEPYHSLQPNAGMMLPVTTEIADRILVLPTGSAINASIISEICKSIS
jgi:dTDP-4-amino-4,6-dideoxygalactose transaminase